MAKHQRLWSKEEVRYLKGHYQRVSRQELMKNLNRTWHSIFQKAYHLHLYRIYEGYPWFSDEIQFLKSNYKKLSVSALSRCLHRSRGSVYHKLLEFNLPTPSKRSYIRPNMTETEKAYVAGFLDGEGWILFSGHFPNGKFWGASPSIGFANTNPEPLKFIAKLLERDSSRDFQKSIKIHCEKRPHKRDLWDFRIWGRYPILFFLESIYPYLIVKKKHAEIMMELIKLRKIGTRWTHSQLRLLLQICELQGIHRTTKLSKYIKTILAV